MAFTAIIADTHYGARGDSTHMLNYFSKFYSDIFFPTLLKYDVKHVIHCGDLVDRRKFLNYNTACRIHDDITKPLIFHDITMDIILGNHDVSFKNTNAVNSSFILYGLNHSHVKFFDSPTCHLHKGRELMYVPWINSENITETIQRIDESKAEYAFGHFEFSGFACI